MTSTVVMIQKDGEPPASYIRYSARLPEFLEQFPLTEGYRVQCQVTDFLSIAPGLRELMREVIRSGGKPSDLGIANVEQFLVTLVCTSRLFAPAGTEPLRTASALAPILQAKDYEALETAANQRLLAAVGIGGTIFDEDEDRARLLLRPQRTHAPQRTNGSQPRSSRADDTPKGGAESPSPEAGSATAIAATGHPTPESAPSSPHAPDAETRSPSSPQNANRPRNAQLTQIRTMAARLGERVPDLPTKEAADAELARLGRLQTERQQREREGRARGRAGT